MGRDRKTLSTFMPESTNPKFGINSWLEDELYHEYLHDRQTVDADWIWRTHVYNLSADRSTRGGVGR